MTINPHRTSEPPLGSGSPPSRRCPVKVLYIAGIGRSGSTILGNVLGEVDGFFCAGEMVKLWHQLRYGGLCGCGRELRACPVWQKILGEWLDIPEEQMEVLNGIWDRPSQDLRTSLRFALAGRRRRRPRPLPPLVADATSATYRQIARTTGATTIVDTSKSPGFAELLAASSDIDLYLLHLVRDPRAVAYSLVRDYERSRGRPPGVRDSVRTSLANLTLKTAQWSFYTLAFDRAWRPRSDRYVLVRYEDFAQRPADSLAQILRFVGESVAYSPFRTPDDTAVELGVNHTAAGHANRLHAGRVEIKPDEEWRARLPRARRRRADLVTLPARAHLDRSHPRTVVR